MSPTTTDGIPIEVHLGPEDWARSLRTDAAAGLTSSPKELSPTWLYDDRGCELFEQITRLPEYYPTRAERAILHERADEIAARVDADVLVELGAGTAEKTRVLLDALDSVDEYVPFDVAESVVVATARAIGTEYPALDVHGVVGDFRRHAGRLPASAGGRGRRLVAFLGGTIGNLRPHERAALLRDLAAAMAPGDALLLGTDLVKDRGRLVAAYDDAAGVTAEFNLNVLRVLNRELGATFPVHGFRHVARFDEDHRWIEMHLQATDTTIVDIAELDLTIGLAAGETIRTEISAKFERAQVTREVTAAGFEPAAWWTDAAGDYALSLAVR